jgi:uncharacterized protein (TIGR00661 family)
MVFFGDYQLRDGLTFATETASISWLKTLALIKPLTFIRDIRNLDLSSYVAVIIDFESVTAWAGWLQKNPVIGVGHQYALATQSYHKVASTYATA